MILENAIDRHGYARIIMAAHHADEGYIEKQLRTRTLWSYDTEDVRESLNRREGTLVCHESTLAKAFDTVFPGLRERMWEGHHNFDYNAQPEEMHHMNVWVIQGHPKELLAAWETLFADVANGPQGADDDTYDYWPSAWGCMLHLAEDLIQLGVLGTDAIERCQVAWDNVVKQYNESQNARIREYVANHGSAPWAKEETLEQSAACVETEIVPRPKLLAEVS